jgi:preprotein translocase subunit YajC
MNSYLPNVLAAMGNSGAGEQNIFMTFLPLLLIIVVFYFFMIRPQLKKQKDLKNYRESLKKGEKVITIGGIYGKIAEIDTNTVILDLGGDVKVKVDKSALIKDPSDISLQK